jgi:two-component system, OmpR family, KDP operon response regulator KdpE
MILQRMPTARRFLVIDDEKQIRRAVKGALSALDGSTFEAGTGTDGLVLAAAQRPDLVVLDLGLPDMEGIEVCRELRSWTNVPVLVLSAREDAREKAALLDAGADDYLTKPFDPVELLARARALLRRSMGDREQPRRIEAGDLVIDLVQRFAALRGQRIHLTPIEWDLLVALSAHPERTLTHQQLFTAVWRGQSHGDAQAYLRVHVAHLRRKIEPDPVRPRHILTEPGVGYRFSL